MRFQNIIFVLVAALIIGASNSVDIPSVDADERPDMVPPSRNQNFPRPCSASWAFAITSVMATQINVKKVEKFPTTVLSPQMLINCAPESVPFQCSYSGAEVNMDSVLTHLLTNGIADETCSNYVADDSKVCDKINQCKRCYPMSNIFDKPKCEAVSYRAYNLNKFEKITSSLEDPTARNTEILNKMITQISDKINLLCQIKHSDAIFGYRANKSETYTEDAAAVPRFSTWVNVVAVVTRDNGTKSIAFRHSFGENVGNAGIVIINADPVLNSFKIFDNCYALDVNMTPKVTNVVGTSVFDSVTQDKGVKRTGNPSAFYKPTADPIDWRNRGGINYVTPNTNMLTESRCVSGWAQAVASTIADRSYIKRVVAKKPFPRTTPSVQAIINCKKGGTCYGGDTLTLVESIAAWKVPVETCQPYQARNPNDFRCAKEQVCANMADDASKITAYDTYNGFKISNIKVIRGAADIKVALADGPIVCDLYAVDGLRGYKSEGTPNLWKESPDFMRINHAVSILGWGVVGADEYWIARNSWGTEWGDNGIIYIMANANVLGVEASCVSFDAIYEDFTGVSA